MAGILVRDDGGEERPDPQTGAEPAEPRNPASSRSAKVLLIALVALQVWIVLPWITGERMLVLRDVVYTPVAGLQFGAELEYKLKDPSRNGGSTSDSLLGMLRVQRDF